MSTQVRTVVRQLARTHIRTFVVFWLVLLAVVTSGVLLLTQVANNDLVASGAQVNVWQPIGQTPPRYYFAVIGIIAACVTLPTYVAHGITRRDFSLASGLFFGASAVAFGLLTIMSYGLESLLMNAADKPWEPAVTSFGGGVLLLVQLSLTYLTWAGTGWLIGAAFYRFGVLVGIFFIPVGCLPILAVEATNWNAGGIAPIVGTGPGLRDLVSTGSLSAPVVALVVVAVAVAGAFWIVRDMPVKKIVG